MTLNKIIILCSVAIVLFSCKKDDATPPKADFLVYNAFCIAPCEVYFFDESERAVSYSWDFGNGVTSTNKDDTISFQYGGNYLVGLEVTAANGVTDLKQKVVTILNADTMFISNIELQQYKTLTTSWTPWDQDETFGEDFYVNILQNGNLIYTSDSIPFSNKSASDLPLTFIVDQILSDDQGTYEIQLFDKDTVTSDDYLGSVSFTPLDYNNSTNPNPPTQIILENSADSLRVRLDLLWLN